MSPAGGTSSGVGAPAITLARLGEVDTLAGTTLEASVVLDPAAEAVTKYEIELVAKDGAAPPEWSRPLWSVSGGPLPAPELGRASHGPPPAASGQGHWFETLDGCPAVEFTCEGCRRIARFGQDLHGYKMADQIVEAIPGALRTANEIAADVFHAA